MKIVKFGSCDGKTMTEQWGNSEKFGHIFLIRYLFWIPIKINKMGKTTQKLALDLVFQLNSLYWIKKWERNKNHRLSNSKFWAQLSDGMGSAP